MRVMVRHMWGRDHVRGHVGNYVRRSYVRRSYVRRVVVRAAVCCVVGRHMCGCILLGVLGMACRMMMGLLRVPVLRSAVLGWNWHLLLGVPGVHWHAELVVLHVLHVPRMTLLVCGMVSSMACCVIMRHRNRSVKQRI